MNKTRFYIIIIIMVVAGLLNFVGFGMEMAGTGFSKSAFKYLGLGLLFSGLAFRFGKKGRQSELEVDE